MDKAVYNLCGRPSIFNPAGFARMQHRYRPPIRTSDLVSNRIEVIQGWGYDKIAQQLKSMSVDMDRSPEVRHQVQLITQACILQPFSHLQMENDILSIKGAKFYLGRPMILSHEIMAQGFVRALQIGDLEAQKIIQAQLETIYLRMRFGADTKALNAFMVKRGVYVEYQSNPSGPFVSDVIMGIEPKTGHAAINIAYYREQPKPIELWHSVYLWRKFVNGVFYYVDDEQVHFSEEVIVHAALHRLLDYYFMLSLAQEFSLSTEEKGHCSSVYKETKSSLVDFVDDLEKALHASLLPLLDTTCASLGLP